MMGREFEFTLPCPTGDGTLVFAIDPPDWVCGVYGYAAVLLGHLAGEECSEDHTFTPDEIKKLEQEARLEVGFG